MHLTHRIGNNMKIKRLCWKWMKAHKCQHASNHFSHFIHFYQIFLIFEISICLGFICSFSSVNLLALPLLCFSTNFESFVNFNLNLVHSIRLYRNSARLHAIEWRWLILKELMMVVKKTKYTARWVSACARGRTVEFSSNVPKQNEFWDTSAIEKTEMKHRETEKKNRTEKSLQLITTLWKNGVVFWFWYCNHKHVHKVCNISHLIWKWNESCVWFGLMTVERNRTRWIVIEEEKTNVEHTFVVIRTRDSDIVVWNFKVYACVCACACV